jgi:hypothetical protein
MQLWQSTQLYQQEYITRRDSNCKEEFLEVDPTTWVLQRQ